MLREDALAVLRQQQASDVQEIKVSYCMCCLCGVCVSVSLLRFASSFVLYTIFASFLPCAFFLFLRFISAHPSQAIEDGLEALSHAPEVEVPQPEPEPEPSPAAATEQAPAPEPEVPVAAPVESKQGKEFQVVVEQAPEVGFRVFPPFVLVFSFVLFRVHEPEDYKRRRHCYNTPIHHYPLLFSLKAKAAPVVAEPVAQPAAAPAEVEHSASGLSLSLVVLPSSSLALRLLFLFSPRPLVLLSTFGILLDLPDFSWPSSPA